VDPVATTIWNCCIRIQIRADADPGKWTETDTTGRFEKPAV